MVQNFSHQNLQGQSFKNQDLTNTNFSDADIRGADFTGAILAGANFHKATAGLALSRILAIVIIAAILSGMSGAAATIAADNTFKSLLPKTAQEGSFIPSAIALLAIAVLSAAIVRQGLQKTLGYLAAAAAVFVPLIGILAALATDKHPILSWMRSFRPASLIEGLAGTNATLTPLLIVNLTAAVAGSMTVVIALSFAVSLAEVVAGKRLAALVVFEAVAISTIATGIVVKNSARYLKANLLIKAGTVDNQGNKCYDFLGKCVNEIPDPPVIIAIVLGAVILAVGLVGLGTYAGSRVLAEDDKYAFIRQFAIAIGAIGGTSFRRADLTNANFSFATLKNTDFRQSNMTHTLWHKSSMLDWAIVGDTILIDPAVRDLLVSRNGRGKSYEQANLRGANLNDTDLDSANLRNADLTEATLQAANLEQSNFTQVQAIGADFSNAQMTGVCGLGSWNIDSTTILEWTDSRWIYLLETPKPRTDDKERRPHNGEFAPDEFTKFFQEVTNTVDLIFRRGLDSTAFNESFRKVQVENEGTELLIQAIENKGDGVVVVKVSVPADADKVKIHQDFLLAYDERLAALDAKYQAQLNSQAALLNRQAARIERIEQEQINKLALFQKITANKPDKLAVITIENGVETQPVTVRVNIWSDDHPFPKTCEGKLPPSAEIFALHRQWKTQYNTGNYGDNFQTVRGDFSDKKSRGSGAKVKLLKLSKQIYKWLEQITSLLLQDYQGINCYPTQGEAHSYPEGNSKIPYRIKINKNQTKNFSIKELTTSAQQLETSFHNWLKSDFFQPIEEKMRHNFKEEDAVRVVIQTNNDLLWRMPWHCWDFCKDYPKAEVGFSGPNSDRIVKIVARNKLRVLAILGDSTGLDLNADKETLKSLPAEVEILEQPTREECDRYLGNEQGWDILCFSGHSRSKADSSTGVIHINSQEMLTIEELKDVFSKAIARNLHLAIFNSCDGLGLARQLADLHLPQMIVMREPVPDRAAQEFLQSFLRYYANGTSLYVSVREARKHLQSIEMDFPCASWLPAIWQNSAEMPQKWEKLSDSRSRIFG